MRHVILLMFLSSCGLLQPLRKKVYYDKDALQKRETHTYFLEFNRDPWDSLFENIDERGKSRYKLIMNNKGQVIKSIELMNSFSEENQKKIRKQIEKLEWLPYLNPDPATTVFTVKRNKRFPSYLGNTPRPLRKNERKKYEID